MTVYVESNFVLEIALGQEQSAPAEAILERAERGDIALALPTFALSEPFARIRRRSIDSRRIAKDLLDHLKDLGRSGPHHEDVRELQSKLALLESIERRELERLTATVRRILPAATAIPLDAAMCIQALHIMGRLGLSHQDSVVYASVLHHLEVGEDPGPHFFVSRDNDFNLPQIVDELRSLTCELVTSFEGFDLLLEQSPPG